MRIETSLAKEMFKSINNYRKVSKLSITEDDMIKYCNTINEINSLGEDDMIYAGQPLNRWNITNFLGFVILPNRVSVGNSNYEKNLLVRPTSVVNADVFSMKEFNEVTEAINICYKKPDGNSTNIESLKTDLLLSNVIGRVMNETKLVMNALDKFMPLQLSVSVISDRYFIDDADDAVINQLKEKLTQG